MRESEEEIMGSSHSRTKKIQSIGYRNELNFKVGHIGEHWKL